MSVLAEVRQALEGVSRDYRTEVAESLARQMDEAPNASSAARLLELMEVLTGAKAEEVVDDVSDIAQARARRRAASTG